MRSVRSASTHSPSIRYRSPGLRAPYLHRARGEEGAEGGRCGEGPGSFLAPGSVTSRWEHSSLEVLLFYTISYQAREVG